MAAWLGGRKSSLLRGSRRKSSNESQFFERRRLRAEASKMGLVASSSNAATALPPGVIMTRAEFYESVPRTKLDALTLAPSAAAATARARRSLKAQRTTSRDLDFARALGGASGSGVVAKKKTTTMKKKKKAEMARTEKTTTRSNARKRLRVEPSQIRYFNDGSDETIAVEERDAAVARAEAAEIVPLVIDDGFSQSFDCG